MGTSELRVVKKDIVKIRLLLQLLKANQGSKYDT